jgi:hypothetical protein
MGGGFFCSCRFLLVSFPVDQYSGGGVSDPFPPDIIVFSKRYIGKNGFPVNIDFLY